MHSMTGFGRASASTEACGAAVEISAVNRKQAEVLVQAPRELAPLEARIRKLVLDAVSRGRVSVAIQLDLPEGADSPVRVDAALARGVRDALRELSGQLGVELTPDADALLRVPGLLRIEDGGIDPELAWPAIEPALHEALREFLAMRAAEGADLARDLDGRLAQLEEHKVSIAALAPQRPVRQRELLMKRLREAGLELELDDERVLREIALFADRCDVSEELTRLEAHLGRFREYMRGDEPVGRPLDFLCQELHREFNTIGSKANDAAIAQHVVAAKTELEKVREQVQNLE